MGRADGTGEGSRKARIGRPLLDLLFPPPAPRQRRRPEQQIYAIDETPPMVTTVAMGLQHALLTLMFSLYSVLTAQSLGMDAHATAIFVSATTFVLGLGTILQAVRSRFGAGIILVGLPVPVMVAVHVAITTQYGLGATMGAILVSALVLLAIARFMPRLRAIFPPEVIGVVLLMLGLELVHGGVSRSFGLGGGASPSLSTALVAGATLACMGGIAVWGSAGLKRAAMALGAAAGILIAILTGQVDADMLAPVMEMPLLALPVLGLDLPMPEFHPTAIAIMLVTSLLVAIDQFASALTMDKMDEADWRRADMGLMARSVTGLGLTYLAHGLTGTLPGGTSSANIGLAHASGITARRVGIAAGLVMIITAFVPPLAGLLAQIPRAVIGGILVYTAAYVIVAGMELVMSRMMNPRRSLTVGLSVAAGAAVMLLPDLARAAPEWARAIVSSGCIVGSLTAVLLNGLFRLGTARSVETTLPREAEAAEAARFLDHWGREWGARREVVLRAATALGEAAELLREDGVQGAFTLQAGFDEFNLVCALSYRGKALRLGEGGAAVDADRLLEMGEDETEALMRQVSSRLLRHLSDRVRSTQSGDTASLRMVFYH